MQWIKRNKIFNAFDCKFGLRIHALYSRYWMELFKLSFDWQVN